MVAVSPRHRRVVIGRGLIKWAIELVRRRAFLEVNLETGVANCAAQQLYGQCGFEIVGQTDEAVLMSLNLGGYSSPRGRIS